MKILITKKIGKSTLQVEVEGQKEEDTFVSASAVTTMPDMCTLCNSEDVELTTNKAQDFTFIKVRCSKCSATSTMGTYKDKSGVFWKSFEIFKKDQE